MPGPVSDSYKGPKDGRVPTWMDEPSPPTLPWPKKREETMQDDVNWHWTINQVNGRSNDSKLFNDLVDEVAQMIKADARMLLDGRADHTARLIMAQLAHVHGLVPIPRARAQAKDAT